jgi:peptidoglycan/xylan/chitin deacetylase (PgdA/CDA1 family)
MLWYQSIPFWFQRLFPNMIWQIPDANDKVVYLTFDDGPHPEISIWVADELEKRTLKGTFFCVGDNVRKFPETHAEIVRRGHQVGNHTMHHLKGWQTKNDVYFNDVQECCEYVNSNLFRPPYGRIKTKQVQELKPKYKIIMWSILSCDFEKNLNCSAALNGLKEKTKNGSIVVFHDSIKAEKNLKQMLPEYLDYLITNGYKCKTL